MRRADRLFRIVEYLKARTRAVRASELAQALEVSQRTIYRDIADLAQSGTPIIGEAGVGYRLDRDYLVRPLAFGLEELDALLLGAEMVRSWGDAALSKSAASALDRLRAVLPQRLREELQEAFLFAYPTEGKPLISVDFTQLRQSIRSRSLAAFDYADGQGRHSSRQVRPLALGFFAPVWLLLAWCETRGDFRNFRLDRMQNLQILPQTFAEEKGRRLQDYLERENLPCDAPASRH